MTFIKFLPILLFLIGCTPQSESVTDQNAKGNCKAVDQVNDGNGSMTIFNCDYSSINCFAIVGYQKGAISCVKK